jgi:hypothetical protein
MQDIITGDAAEAIDTYGWFVGGDFLPDSAGIRKNDTVEIKWGVHQAGEKRPIRPATGKYTVSLLVSGEMDVVFETKTVKLNKQGQYIVFGPDLAHGAHMVKDSVIVTVRW